MGGILSESFSQTKVLRVDEVGIPPKTRETPGSSGPDDVLWEDSPDWNETALSRWISDHRNSRGEGACTVGERPNRGGAEGCAGVPSSSARRITASPTEGCACLSTDAQCSAFRLHVSCAARPFPERGALQVSVATPLVQALPAFESGPSASRGAEDYRALEYDGPLVSSSPSSTASSRIPFVLEEYEFVVGSHPLYARPPRVPFPLVFPGSWTSGRPSFTAAFPVCTSTKMRPIQFSTSRWSR